MNSPALREQPEHIPYADEPLLPPNRGGIALSPRPDSMSTLTSAMHPGKESSWGSRASLGEDHGLLGAQSPIGPAGPGFVQHDAAGGFYEKTPARGASTSRKRWLVLGSIAALVVAIIIAVAVYFGAVRPHKANASPAPGGSTPGGSGPAAGSSTSSGSSASPSPGVLITGGDGSTVTTDAGVFIYNNSFGGYWYEDPANLYTASGKANSWTPAVNDTWQWGVDHIYGVNLGGWLVLEPFITPSLYEKYQTTDIQAVDEWTLSLAMTADTSSTGGLSQIEDHYKTFITEIDFAQIAAAGLNWVRIPFPFWAVSKQPNEPFLEGVAWTYFLKAIGWARKYGLRINIDLHTIPGSQNGWNHSGKLGEIDFMQGAMGLVNGQRTLDYLRIITEFISQPQYSSVVAMFGIMNEPRGDSGPGIEIIKSFYYQAYTVIRGVTGLGAGNGPMMSIFHAFAPDAWAGWLPNSDRIAFDYHPYIIFAGALTNEPPASYASGPCTGWGDFVNATSSDFGFIASGEWSNAINDCGLWINAVGGTVRFEQAFGAGSCDVYNSWQTWNASLKAGFETFATAQMDSLRDWFFWTWKIGPSSISGNIEAPMWSYQLGWQNGWMPLDPRTAIGTCAAQGFAQDSPFDGAYEPWQTGGPGGVLTPATTEDYSWPPPTLNPGYAAAQMPMYTPTGAIPTLPVPTATGTPNPGTGWSNSQDTRGAYVPIPGCTYLDNWSALNMPLPDVCSSS